MMPGFIGTSERMRTMFKRILCIAVLCACVSTLICSCSVIDDSSEASGSVTDASDGLVLSADSSESLTPVEPPDESGWIYSFGSEFIDENGIRFVWDSIDEDTRYNLGEVLNAIRNVQVYCPLTVGFPKEETQDFLELISNCSTFYTYSSGKFKFHYDESGRVKGLTIVYSVDYEEEAIDRTKKLDEALDRILIGMPQSADEFDKIRYLHDYVVLNCLYSEGTQSCFNAYGAIIEHSAACQGYADGLMLLMSRAGFEVMFATGRDTESDIKHKWCYVKLSDGHWYAIDPTWDDLKGGDISSDYIGYNYFLVSDESLLKDHSVRDESRYYKLPAADSMDMSFYKVMGYTVGDAETAFAVLRGQAQKAAIEGRRHLYLKAEDGASLEDIYAELASGPSGDNRMEEIIAAANKAAGEDVYAASWVKTIDPVLGTLVITLKYNDN